MEVTRRFWTTIVVAVLLVFWGVFLQRLILLIGSGLVLAWVLAQQYQFVRTTSRLHEGLRVEQQLSRSRVSVDEVTLCTLSVEAPIQHSGNVTVSATPPIAATSADASCTVGPEVNKAETTFEITWPVAGTFQFGQPTVTVTDPLGLFSQTMALGSTPSMTVEPRVPREIHVGEGGNQVAAGVGEHVTGQSGSGLTPAEVRKYVPGDSTNRIDWKATARLDEPHVREFEAETDLQTQLFVDHRASMGVGPAGEQKLDFGRQVALALVENAQELSDPLGWYAVGDEGITATATPATGPEHYRSITQQIQTLAPTTSGPDKTPSEQLSPAQARRLANQLDRDTPFDSHLQPFFQATDIYIQRIERDPLFNAVRLGTKQVDGTVRAIIITDDTNRVELREAIKVTQQQDGEVVVFLTPSTLYESYDKTDITAVYEEYSEFESFRRELASLPGVSAFEVGPRDQVATVLAAAKPRGKA